MILAKSLRTIATTKGYEIEAEVLGFRSRTERVSLNRLTQKDENVHPEYYFYFPTQVEGRTAVPSTDLETAYKSALRGLFLGLDEIRNKSGISSLRLSARNTYRPEPQFFGAQVNIAPANHEVEVIQRLRDRECEQWVANRMALDAFNYLYHFAPSPRLLAWLKQMDSCHAAMDRRIPQPSLLCWKGRGTRRVLENKMADSTFNLGKLHDMGQWTDTHFQIAVQELMQCEPGTLPDIRERVYYLRDLMWQMVDTPESVESLYNNDRSLQHYALATSTPPTTISTDPMSNG